MFLGYCKIRIIFKSFLVPREDIKKMLSCGLPREISTQAHMIDKVPGMCKAIVDAGLFTFADIDRFPTCCWLFLHLPHQVLFQLEGSAVLCPLLQYLWETLFRMRQIQYLCPLIFVHI